MHPTVSQYAQALNELARDTSVPTATIVKNFFSFLKRRGENVLTRAVLQHLERMENVAQNVVEVMVVTAREVSPHQAKRLQKQAQALFPDKQVILKYRVDASVIGGALFRTEEIQYDATLRASLDSLKAVLLKTEAIR